jgi:hypothetical protein
MSDDPNDIVNTGEDDAPDAWEQFAIDPPIGTESTVTKPEHAVGSEAEMVGDDHAILDEALARKTRGEYSEVNRNRDALLDSVDLNSPENKTLRGRIDSLKIDGLFAMLPDDPMDRIDRYRGLIEGRLKSLPAYAFYDLKPKMKIDGSVSIRSERMASIIEDADEIQKSLTLSAHVITSLYEKLHEQIALHEELLEHAKTVKQTQHQAMAALPGWSLELARFVEALGIQSETVKRNRTEIHNALKEALAEFVADDKRSDIMVAYLEDRSNIDEVIPTPSNDVTSKNIDEPIADIAPIFEPSPSATDMIAPTLELASTIAEIATTDVSPLDHIAPTVLDNVVDQPAKPALSFCGDFNPADHDIIPFDPTRTNTEPTQGICRIDGIEKGHGLSGLFSQFDYEKIDGLKSILAQRMDQRSQWVEHLRQPFSKNCFGASSNAWNKYDVPIGDYVIVQKKGRSSILPDYQLDTYLPPYHSMASYLGLLSDCAPEIDLPLKGNLLIWDCLTEVANGEKYMRYHIDGRHRGGDPQQAYELIRQVVPLYLKLASSLTRPDNTSELVKEHMVRFWLFLLVGRMRGNMLNALWPDGFFHGVHGFDPVLKDKGHMVLYRAKAGSIANSIEYTMGEPRD